MSRFTRLVDLTSPLALTTSCLTSRLPLGYLSSTYAAEAASVAETRLLGYLPITSRLTVSSASNTAMIAADSSEPATAAAEAEPPR